MTEEAYESAILEVNLHCNPCERRWRITNAIRARVAAKDERIADLEHQREACLGEVARLVTEVAKLRARIEGSTKVWLCYDGDKLVGASHHKYNPWQGGMFRATQFHAVPVTDEESNEKKD